jgi:hypothetical protein
MAYGDSWRVMRAMTRLVITALFILLLFNAAQKVFSVDDGKTTPMSVMLGFVLDIVQSFYLTPFMIAVHRFIILEEVTSGYSLDPRQTTFAQYFGWLVGFAIVSLASSLFDLLPPSTFRSVVTIVVFLVLFIALIRLTILLPAIAVGAHGATASNAVADTKGRSLDIFLIFLTALLPFLAVAIALAVAQQFIVGRVGVVAAVTNLLGVTIMQVIALILSLAISSRMFQAFADRMLRAA